MIVFLFGCTAKAQYNPEILGYNIYFFKLNEGQIFPEAQTIVKQDTTLQIVWEHHPDTEPPEYISPYSSTVYHVEWVDNTSALWGGDDTTSYFQGISYESGFYELTVTAIDTLQYQSGHSQPWFMLVTAQIATIPFNLKIVR